MPVADLTINMIEFFDDASNSEGRRIPQSTASNPGIATTDA
jgi:signal recognition particle subunit SEC65